MKCLKSEKTLKIWHMQLGWGWGKGEKEEKEIFPSNLTVGTLSFQHLIVNTEPKGNAILRYQFILQ